MSRVNKALKQPSQYFGPVSLSFPVHSPPVPYLSQQKPLDGAKIKKSQS